MQVDRVVRAAVTAATLVILTTPPLFATANAHAHAAFAQDTGPDDNTDAVTPTVVDDEAAPPDATATATPLTEANVAAAVAPSVVQIITPDGTGSGVRIADGILTDEHVIDGAERVQVQSADGTRVDALVIRADTVSDLALLQTNLPLPALELEEARRQPQGSPVLLMGYPKTSVLGTGQATLTRGIVSAIRNGEDGVTYVQTDTAMNPGNSGGPLLNLRGHVIGVAEAKLKDTEGINIAVATESIQAFLSGPVHAAPEATYNTRKGPRTADQLHQELAAAGYGGPWDIPAMLAAYERATAPTPIPTPTPNPLVAQCQAVAVAYQSFNAAVQDAERASARNDYQSLRSIAANLRSRTYPNLLLPMVNAFLRMIDWEAAGAEIRFNWPLLVVTAARTPGGDLLLAAAQADLNRDDGEVRVAALDLATAVGQLKQTCGW